MSTFIMLTRLNSEAASTPQAIEQLEQHAMKCIRKECPKVEWLASYAALGPYDYLDIFRADDIETATKVSALIRTFGHAHAEVWPATEWKRFKQIMHALPARA
jgi:uncharacterized protein with GYD domain